MSPALYFSPREKLLGNPVAPLPVSTLLEWIRPMFSDAQISPRTENEVEFGLVYDRTFPEKARTRMSMRASDGSVVWTHPPVIPVDVVTRVGEWMIEFHDDDEVWLISDLGEFARKVDTNNIAEIVRQNSAHIMGVDEDSPTLLSR